MIKHALIKHAVWVLALAIFSQLALGAEKSVARRPNLLVFITDDQGYGDVGRYGCQDIPTPNIDGLAAEGVRMTSGYVVAPLCSPSRAGFLTGRYHNRFGLVDNRLGESKTGGMDLKEKTIADVLGSAGYATGLLGKWHEGRGANGEFLPVKRGFQEFYGYYGAFGQYFPKKMIRGEQEVAETEYCSDAYAREACAFIEKHKDKPFFLNVAFNAPHYVMQAKPALKERFKDIPNELRRTYAAVITSLDEAVGRVMAKLKETGLDQDTLVVFISDNGDGGAPPYGGSNKPLRGGKSQLFEGGIRTPQIWRWSGVLPKGKVYDEPVISMDIMASAVAAAGLTAPAPLDGVNVVPYLKGEKTGAPHEFLFWKFGGRGVVRRGNWKLMMGESAGGKMELYDLAADISEANNVAEQHGEIVTDLKKAYVDWNSQLPPPVKIPQDPAAIDKKTTIPAGEKDKQK